MAWGAGRAPFTSRLSVLSTVRLQITTGRRVPGLPSCETSKSRLPLRKNALPSAKVTVTVTGTLNPTPGVLAVPLSLPTRTCRNPQALWARRCGPRRDSTPRRGPPALGRARGDSIRGCPQADVPGASEPLVTTRHDANSLGGARSQPGGLVGFPLQVRGRGWDSYPLGSCSSCTTASPPLSKLFSHSGSLKPLEAQLLILLHDSVCFLEILWGGDGMRGKLNFLK